MNENEYEKLLTEIAEMLLAFPVAEQRKIFEKYLNRDKAV